MPGFGRQAFHVGLVLPAASSQTLSCFFLFFLLLPLPFPLRGGTWQGRCSTVPLRPQCAVFKLCRKAGQVLACSFVVRDVVLGKRVGHYLHRRIGLSLNDHAVKPWFGDLSRSRKSRQPASPHDQAYSDGLNGPVNGPALRPGFPPGRCRSSHEIVDAFSSKQDILFFNSRPSCEAK